MGRKVHPIGFRIGTIRDWQAKWYADKHYPEFLHEDLVIRKAISDKYADASVSQVDIERSANKVSISIYTARPGIVIGRGGQRVDEVRRYLEELIGKRVQLNIQEVRQPELDAYLVARMVAEQIERRIAYRRAMKQAIFRTLQAGAQGMKISCSGRLGGVEIARRQMMHRGRVPLHTLRADVDYGITEAHTTLGRIGIKVWIYRGDVFPELEKAAKPAAEAQVSVTPEEPAALPEKQAPAAEVAPAEAEAGEEKAEAKPAKPRARKKAEAVAEPEPAAETKPEEEAKPAKPRAKKAAPIEPEEKAPAAKKVKAAQKAEKTTEKAARTAKKAEELPAEEAEKPKARVRKTKKTDTGDTDATT